MEVAAATAVAAASAARVPAVDSAAVATAAAAAGARTARQKDFGPPAPPKDKKKPFKKNEDKPRGPIPTKFTGRMYDLDGTEDDDAIDITPDFMKHEDPEVERRRADATGREPRRPRRRDAGCRRNAGR